MKDKDAEQAILELDKLFLDAFLKNDVATVDRILPEDFIAIFPNGQVADKQTELENVRNASVNSYSTEAVEVCWYLETVVAVHFLMTLDMADKGKKQVRDLHVYLKRDDEWQMITGQVTPVLTA